ncbi:MAG: DUF3054 domain-containing protein [Chloroflexi bacterium AL-W]|nr:DUF3054 domain-containing protein [Chloroflexi bacterium AL-N1]NOK66199.1 DUF3054 domain-containing protein [Chloroflexi bacterium AL-N10]NOK73080.1 DUF3054 domain-containing protein [Chloroflexi bacterium AL-N5]NOK79977.1 DUF3054 domain-containing protein [Chloroflexi bacterium AL-W]NOK88167.1 DUF3054 domain-containing protein [Chloroflexi bacterium AL-N15]
MALTDHPRSTPNSAGLQHTVALVSGDIASFFVFAMIGLASHRGITSLVNIPDLAITAAPFALGWFIVAPFTGVFKPAITSRLRSMLTRTALTWVGGCLIGLVVRALINQSGVPPLTFALITFTTILLILSAWRGSFAWFVNRHHTTTPETT